MSSYVGSNQDIQAGSGSERSKIILCMIWYNYYNNGFSCCVLLSLSYCQRMLVSAKKTKAGHPPCGFIHSGSGLSIEA